MLYIGIFFAILASIINFMVGSPLIRLLINSIASGFLSVLVAMIVQKVIAKSLPSLLEANLVDTSMGDANSTMGKGFAKGKRMGGITDMDDGIDESLKTVSFTNLENVALDTGELSRAFSNDQIKNIAGAVRSTLNTKE